jgi:hypothetical protein
MRYISDGNPQVVCVPASLKSRVDAAAVAKLGERLQLYSLTGVSGGALSVEDNAGAATNAAKPALGGGSLSVEAGAK